MQASSPSPEEYWQSAVLLFQPALIRLLDQLRQQLLEAGWKAEYETREIWPTSPNPPDAQVTGEETPPQILYLVHLQRENTQARVNLWELCYQICFQDYQPQINSETIRDFQPGQVATDMSLIDANTEVNWHALDRKTHQVVAQLLHSLTPETLKDARE
jgi:hypothetical protein